jgi:hypothetical protein
MELTPTQESFVKGWLKRRKAPVDLPKRKALDGNQKKRSLKWNDDSWFENRYGDPDYYKRVNGLE